MLANPPNWVQDQQQAFPTGPFLTTAGHSSGTQMVPQAQLHEKTACVVALTKPVGGKLGLNTEEVTHAGRQALKVMAVREGGAAMAWNQANPSCLIQEGDVIVSINNAAPETVLLTNAKEQETLNLHMIPKTMPILHEEKTSSVRSGRS